MPIACVQKKEASMTKENSSILNITTTIATFILMCGFKESRLSKDSKKKKF